jgi:hypothetical protein
MQSVSIAAALRLSNNGSLEDDTDEADSSQNERPFNGNQWVLESLSAATNSHITVAPTKLVEQKQSNKSLPTTNYRESE